MSAVTRATNSSVSAPSSAAAIEPKSSTSKYKPKNGDQFSDRELHKIVDAFKKQIMVAEEKYPDMDFADQLSFDRDKFLQQVRETAVEQKNWNRVSLINKIFSDISPNHFMLRSTSQNEAKNGDHISDEELCNTLFRFNLLIRVAATKFPKGNLANQLALDRNEFLQHIREKADEQKNWSRLLFINKIFLEITADQCIHLIRLGQIEKLIYLLSSDVICISPKVLAVAREYPTIERIIISQLKKSTHLSRAAKRGLDDCVLLSLKHGADPNWKDDSGETALHCAALKGNPKVVRILLDHKADANIADAKGNTPLVCALNSGCQESQDLLFPLSASSLFNNPNLSFEVLTPGEYDHELEEGSKAGTHRMRVPTLDVGDAINPLLDLLQQAQKKE